MDSSEDRGLEQHSSLEGRKQRPQRGAVDGLDEQDIACRRETDCLPKQRRGKGEKLFTKLMNLGANSMATDIFCRNTQVLMILTRDASYNGICYTQPRVIADELGMDVTATRKNLKTLQANGFIRRLTTKSGGTGYLLNPHYFAIGDSRSEAIALRMWSRGIEPEPDDVRKILRRIADRSKPRAD